MKVRSRRRHDWAALAVALLALSLCGAFGPQGLGGAPVAGAAEHALADFYFQTNLGDPAERAASIADFRRLHTRWQRIDVAWSALEPTQGTYDEVQLAWLDAAVDELRAADIKVILTVAMLPTWAQDRSYGGFAGAAPPIRDDALDDFGRLGEFLATHFAGRVSDFECWNEPNLWGYIYPQRTADDAYFAARLYLPCSRRSTPASARRHRRAGRRRSHRSTSASTTATAPARSASRASWPNGAAAYFDVYSHHPYTPGGTLHPRPRRAQRPDHHGRPPEPADAAQALPGQALLPDRVRLQHQLQRGVGFTVNELQQANYLRRPTPT